MSLAPPTPEHEPAPQPTRSTVGGSSAPRRPAAIAGIEARLAHDDSLCVSCGACVAHCAVAALVVDESYRITFSARACRACTLCLPACAYGALTLATATQEQQS